MSNRLPPTVSPKNLPKRITTLQQQPMVVAHPNSIDKIYASTLKLLKPRSPKELYKTSVIEAARLVGAESGSLFLVENNKLFRVFSNVPKQLRMVPHSKGNVYTVYQEQTPRSLSFSRLKKSHPEIADTIGSIILIPLTYGRIKLGVISLITSPDRSKPLSKRHKQYLKLFGSLISVAIHNLQLYRQKHQALKSRELFMSMASHELKNPLTSINSYAQVMQQALIQKKSIEVKWVETILNNVKKLQTIIEDLLQVNDITRGTFSINYKEIELLELIKSTVTQFQLNHPQKVVITSEPGKTFPMNSDPSKISMIITNILNNSAKYSKPNSTIIISVNCRAHRQVEITIIDQGVGISKKDLAYVFESFYQGKHSKVGMGLGLFICREIVTALGGDISIESKLNHGTTVRILLPR